MPISKYYQGSGEKVMSAMKKEYGDKKGKQVFYATANKKGQNPKNKAKTRSARIGKNLKAGKSPLGFGKK